MSKPSLPPPDGGNESLLVIGGCRSGKSRYAEQWAESQPAETRIYVATCVPHDAEMQDRVAQHRRRRSAARWQTVEEPMHPAEVIRTRAAPGCVVLVDCLTLWITNLLLDSENADLEGPIAALRDSLREAGGPVVLVSNEVGTGIVPENALARRFRDAAGLVNQKVAAAADRVVWMVAGIPVTVKPAADRKPNRTGSP